MIILTTNNLRVQAFLLLRGESKALARLAAASLDIYTLVKQSHSKSLYG